MSQAFSIIYIVYNQADLLKRSLKNISPCPYPLHIVDLSNSLEIKSLAKAHQAQYHSFPYVTTVEQIRAKAFKLAKTSYVLYLDGDEMITKSSLAQLEAALATKPSYVRLPRHNYVFGKVIKTSRYYPDYQLRLFHKDLVTWPTILHHPPQAQGEGIDLPLESGVYLTHYNYQNINEWLSKNMRYAQNDAETRLKDGEDYSLSKAISLSVSEIMSRYYQQAGYRDGYHGLMLSLLQAFYYFLVFAYYWELKKYQLPKTPLLGSFYSTWFRHGLSEALYWEQDNNATLLKKIRSKIIRKVIHDQDQKSA